MSVETFEAAIVRLEELKAGSELVLPLSSGFYGSGDAWPEGTHLSTRNGAEMMRVEGENAVELHLLAALSRSVDPLIAMHRRSAIAMKAAIGSGMSEADVNEIAERSGEMALARAILGEVEHDQKCKHKSLDVIVTNQPEHYDNTCSHRSTWVCARQECVWEAAAWVMRGTGETPWWRIGVDGSWSDEKYEVEHD